MNEQILQTKIRRTYPHLFPNSFETTTTIEDLANVQTYLNPRANFESLTYEEYIRNFHQHPPIYDLHEINFQNFALEQTKDKSIEELRQLALSKDHAKKRLLRTRVYAISTRDDLDWNGNILGDDSSKLQKRTEMNEYFLSCKLYDWARTTETQRQNILSEATTREEPCTYDVWPIGTQEAATQATQDNPGYSVCWLNLANAHNTCGTYNVAFGGSQEEEVATNCNAAAILGIHAHKVRSGVRYFVQKKETHVMYNEGKHIPPGGNYFCRTKFLTSKVNDEHVECSMIAAAFADFRLYSIFHCL